MTEPPHQQGSATSQPRFTHSPDQAKIAVFLTRDLNRFIFRYLFVAVPIAFIALFVFDDLFGQVLHFVGYASLGLLKEQYAYSVGRIGDPSLVDFKLLEIVAWFSIAVWGARTIIGLIFLKQYDGSFLIVSETHHGKMYGALICGLLTLYVATNVQLQFAIPLFLAYMIELPRVYFIIISIMWFWSLCMVSSAILFIVWKLFRQKRLGAARLP